MARPDDSTKPRRPRAGALVALAALTALLLPTAAFAGAAVDEYSLGPVGGNDTGREADVQRTPDEAEGKPPRQLGIVGENVPAQSPLEAAGAAAWIALAVVALGALALFLRRRPDETWPGAGART